MGKNGTSQTPHIRTIKEKEAKKKNLKWNICGETDQRLPRSQRASAQFSLVLTSSHCDGGTGKSPCELTAPECPRLTRRSVSECKKTASTGCAWPLPRSHPRVAVHAVDQVVHLGVVLPPVALVGLRDEHGHRHQEEEQAEEQDGQ